MNRFFGPLQAMQQVEVPEAPTDHESWLEEFSFVPLPEGEEIPRLVFV